MNTTDTRTPEQIARDDQILIDRARYAALQRRLAQEAREQALAEARRWNYWRRL